MTDCNVCGLWQSWTVWELGLGILLSSFSGFQGAFIVHMLYVGTSLRLSLFCCRWWACKTQSSNIKWVSSIYSQMSILCSGYIAQHLLFVKNFIFLVSLITFLNVSSDRLANNDLLSLDPFGPTLGGSSSYSAPASTGNFYTSSFAFWAGLFLRGLSKNCWSTCWKIKVSSW